VGAKGYQDMAVDENTARRGVRIDHVDGAEALVRHVVIDDDELVGSLRIPLEVAKS